MKDKQREQDRHLQAPGEANRDKHINFLAEEREVKKIRPMKEETPLLATEQEIKVREKITDEGPKTGNKNSRIVI